MVNELMETIAAPVINVSMTAAQSAAFSSYGAWLSPNLVATFFACLFSALALFTLSSLAVDCYQAWQNGDLKIGEASRITLEFIFLVTVLIALIR